MHVTWLKLAILLTGYSLLACDSAPSRDRTSAEDPGDGQHPGPTISGTPDAPSEAELEENFRSPVVSGPYLWSANPETNRVARIDARTLEVDVLDGGHAPTFVAALPQGSTPGGALVLNMLGGDASVFTVGSNGGMGGASSTGVIEKRIPVQEGASAWSVSRTGRHAIAWARFEEDLLGPLDGYQDLTVLSLEGSDAEGTKLSIGFRPSQVRVNEQETRAYVVSKPGISVIELSADPPKIEREIFLPEDHSGQARDVSFTPDGAYAFVRLARSSDVLIIRTEDDTRVTVSLPSEVTDLDLSGDGSLAVAVMRGELHPATPAFGRGGAGLGGQGGQGGPGGLGDPGGAAPGGAGATASFGPSRVALLPVPAIFDEPDDFELVETTELVGSVVVSHQANAALLFTSAVANSRLTVLRLDTHDLRTVDLQAPVQAAFVSQDGQNMVAVMTPPAGSTRAGAFALMRVFEDRPPRIEGTSTVPRFVALSGDRSLVTTWGAQTVAAATFLGSFPRLVVDRVALTSEPLASGMIPEAGQGFVAQAHPEGRVTFVDFESASAATVTGFELASKAVER